jgi:hypothetical protein
MNAIDEFEAMIRRIATGMSTFDDAMMVRALLARLAAAEEKEGHALTPNPLPEGEGQSLGGVSYGGTD